MNWRFLVSIWCQPKIKYFFWGWIGASEGLNLGAKNLKISIRSSFWSYYAFLSAVEYFLWFTNVMDHLNCFETTLKEQKYLFWDGFILRLSCSIVQIPMVWISSKDFWNCQCTFSGVVAKLFKSMVTISSKRYFFTNRDLWNHTDRMKSRWRYELGARSAPCRRRRRRGSCEAGGGLAPYQAGGSGAKPPRFFLAFLLSISSR